MATEFISVHNDELRRSVFISGMFKVVVEDMSTPFKARTVHTYSFIRSGDKWDRCELAEVGAPTLLKCNVKFWEYFFLRSPISPKVKK